MEKYLSLIILAFMICFVSNAQYRNVKLPEAPKQTGYKNYNFENAGFWYALEAESGSSVMEQKKNMQYANLTFTGGYRLNEYLRFGAGLGIRYYINNAEVRNTDNDFVFPIFANLRGNFISAYDRDGVPFWSINAGTITKEGLFASPSVGYRFGGLRNNFQIAISYTVSQFKNYNEENTTYSYLGLKIGYEF